jgi:serine/threonine protein phosphatase PrpC/Leucine-rich repeat (LRR) protein
MALDPVDLIRQLYRQLNSSSLSFSRLTIVEIPAILLHLPLLTSFDLSSNPIGSLDRLWEADLPSLHELNLSACWLRSLPYGIPKFAPTLETLILDGNFLGRSCPNFSVFTRLRTLSLVGNDFMEIPKLPLSLQILIFRMNSFGEIPPCGLSELDAGYCDPRPPLAIHCRQLTRLRLNHCGLTGHIRLSALPLLTFLDLSNNALTSFEFENSRRISELHLSFNGLAEFPFFLNSLPGLRELDLSHNAIDAVPKDLTLFKRLETLDISHNQLITPRLRLPSRLTSIRVGFNFSVGFEVFPPLLRELDASFCAIAVLPPVTQSMEWLALYFVKTVILSDTRKALTLETGEDADRLANALVPADAFQKRVVLTTPQAIDAVTLINERMADGIGCSATSGRSTKYEDNFLSVRSEGVSFVGVFDGHAGHESAFVSAQTFASLLGPLVGRVFRESPGVVKKAIRHSFCLVNDELRRRAVKDGTTAVIVGVTERRAVVGHLGDSLALLVTANAWEFLTRPHRPTDKAEYLRMRKQRKSVTSDWRVDGKLSVSRSLGDFWCCDGMFDEPDVVVRDMPTDAMSIVLACDGLWDYVDPGSVCNVVRAIREPARAAKLLQDYAFASGSHDSISVIVVNVPVVGSGQVVALGSG